MNSISEALHISKRTLYQVFLSKSELLEACVSFQIEKSRKQIEEKCRTLNCLEAELSDVCPFGNIVGRFLPGDCEIPGSPGTFQSGIP